MRPDHLLGFAASLDAGQRGTMGAIIDGGYGVVGGERIGTRDGAITVTFQHVNVPASRMRVVILPSGEITLFEPIA